MITRIKNGRVVLPGGVAEDTYIYLNDGLISAVTKAEMPFDQELDAPGR